MSSMLGLAPGDSGAPLAPPPAPLPILARAVAAAGALGLEVIVSLLLILFCRLRIDIIDRLLAKVSVPPDEIQANDAILFPLSRLPIALLVLSAVTFLLWFHRASANLRAFRSDVFQFTPKDAVLSFLIPVISLFRPPAVMSEIWRASDPGIPPFAEKSWASAKGTPLVALWWGLFLVRGVVGGVSGSSAGADGSLTALRRGASVIAFNQVLNIAAAVPAILLIVMIQRRQEALKEQLAPPPPAP